MKLPLRNNKWLRRCHAWLGFTLLPLILIYAFSGIYLQHRHILKIPGSSASKAHEKIVLEVPLNNIHEFKIFIEKTYPDYAEKGEFTNTKSISLETLHSPLVIPPKWEFSYVDIKHKLTVGYIPETLIIDSEFSTNNIIETLKNLHKGKGMGPAWILFSDLASLALIILSITSLFMWTRLHGKPNIGSSLLVIGTILTVIFSLVS